MGESYLKKIVLWQLPINITEQKRIYGESKWYDILFLTDLKFTKCYMLIYEVDPPKSTGWLYLIWNQPITKSDQT